MKAEVTDLCTSSFQADIGDLERATGKMQRWCLLASLVAGEDCTS